LLWDASLRFQVSYPIIDANLRTPMKHVHTYSSSGPCDFRSCLHSIPHAHGSYVHTMCTQMCTLSTESLSLFHFLSLSFVLPLSPSLPTLSDAHRGSPPSLSRALSLSLSLSRARSLSVSSRDDISFTCVGVCTCVVCVCERERVCMCVCELTVRVNSLCERECVCVYVCV
jgi:hypothetical protein